MKELGAGRRADQSPITSPSTSIRPRTRRTNAVPRRRTSSYNDPKNYARSRSARTTTSSTTASSSPREPGFYPAVVARGQTSEGEADRVLAARRHRASDRRASSRSSFRTGSGAAAASRRLHQHLSGEQAGLRQLRHGRSCGRPTRSPSSAATCARGRRRTRSSRRSCRCRATAIDHRARQRPHAALQHEHERQRAAQDARCSRRAMCSSATQERPAHRSCSATSDRRRDSAISPPITPRSSSTRTRRWITSRRSEKVVLVESGDRPQRHRRPRYA